MTATPCALMKRYLEANPITGVPLSVYRQYFAAKSAYPIKYVEQHPNFWDDDNLRVCIQRYNSNVASGQTSVGRFLTQVELDEREKEEETTSSSEEDEEQPAAAVAARGGRTRVPKMAQDMNVTDSLF
jgi:hypothetical protein